MKERKQIAYWYNGRIAGDETEVDMEGDMRVPVKGDKREHKGRTWKVEAVMTKRSGDGSLPIYNVYLIYPT
jgi:hypothetical protein